LPLKRNLTDFICRRSVLYTDGAGADVIHWALLRCGLCRVHFCRHCSLHYHCTSDWVTWSYCCSHPLHIHAPQHCLSTNEVRFVRIFEYSGIFVTSWVLSCWLVDGN